MEIIFFATCFCISLIAAKKQKEEKTAVRQRNSLNLCENTIGRFGWLFHTVSRLDYKYKERERFLLKKKFFIEFSLAQRQVDTIAEMYTHMKSQQRLGKYVFGTVTWFRKASRKFSRNWSTTCVHLRFMDHTCCSHDVMPLPSLADNFCYNFISEVISQSFSVIFAAKSCLINKKTRSRGRCEQQHISFMDGNILSPANEINYFLRPARTATFPKSSVLDFLLALYGRSNFFFCY